MTSTSGTPAIGVVFHPSFPPGTLAGFARRAEEAGFDELWLWDDCFQPGALTSAAIALSATTRLKVGIGLLPATVIHPLFAAMEITTLARAFPQRILPGFGFGFGPWMVQIGAKPKSYLTALEETVTAVRRILAGEKVTAHGEQVNVEDVQLHIPPDFPPPLYIGAMREKALRLAGRVGDGTILTAMSSPEYVRWSVGHIRAGMAEAGRASHRVVAYLDVKVGADGKAARDAARLALAERMPWADSQVNALGIAQEYAALDLGRGVEGVTEQIPDAWVNEFCATGTPEETLAAIERMAQAGVDSVVLQPLNGDPDGLEEYIRYLMPALKA
ncbi:MAG TPA: LLM class flavin-dependent oxidoreductase [Anaerolinea sp.]|nr:LLM class flavin-dependent oxidoreductase [Anaerolinea sp.]